MSRYENHLEVSERSRQAYEIVCEVVRRRHTGEFISDEAVLEKHPALADQLGDMLRRAVVVDRIAQRASGGQWAQAFSRMKDDDKLDPDSLAPVQAIDVEATIQHEPPAGRGSTLVKLNQDIEIAESLGLRRNVASQGTISDLGTQGQRKTAMFASIGELRETRLGTPARRYRPQHRPPAALLEVFDDDQNEVELVRIRNAQFTIGREEGDLVIPHETQMSRRHASIQRRRENGSYRWFLRDLGSTNGTYIGAQRIALKHDDDLLIGGVLVRFFQPGGPETASLGKVNKQVCEEQVPLQPDECWIGTDSQRCLNFLAQNPYLDPCHIRLVVDADRRWRICDEQSTNGVFVRISEIELRNGGVFHAGEQRFRFRVP